MRITYRAVIRRGKPYDAEYESRVTEILLSLFDRFDITGARLPTDTPISNAHRDWFQDTPLNQQVGMGFRQGDPITGRCGENRQRSTIPDVFSLEFGIREHYGAANGAI